MTRYAIGLGSNLGDRISHLRAADNGLSSLGRVVARSSLYETVPVGGPEQGPYLNAVVLVDSDLGPHQVLEACLKIEASRGRDRELHWGPRTLDMDIITSDGPPVSDEKLTIPHPLAADREFVLRPLREVWPDAPVSEEHDASTALAELSPQGVDRLAGTWERDLPIGNWLATGQLLLILLTGFGLLQDGSADFDDQPFVRGIGLVLAVIGAILGGAASAAAGRDLTVSPDPKPNASLREAGVYGVVRHPMYGGLLLLVLGTALAAGSLYGVVGWLALVVLVMVKLDYEERRLRIRFPAYAAYRRRVPRRLIPGIF